MRIFFFSLLMVSGSFCFGQQANDLRNLALSGDSTAMLRLSELFQFGRGVPQNEDSVAYWVRKSAEANHPEAMFLEGLKSVDEIFSEKKFREGITWMEKSVAAGNVNAMVKLSELYLKTSPPGSSGSVFVKFRDPGKALKYARMAMEVGSKPATRTTAWLLMDGGKGITKDSIEAARLMEKCAVEWKDPEAQLALAQWYFDRRVTGRTEARRAFYFADMAFNNPKSNIDLGTMADIERQRCEQYLRRLHNASLQNCWFLRPGQAELPVREL